MFFNLFWEEKIVYNLLLNEAKKGPVETYKKALKNLQQKVWMNYAYMDNA